MDLLISDANILIDAEEGQIVELMFRLPYAFHIPDILFVEELAARHHRLLALGLVKAPMSGETVRRAMGFVDSYRRVSRNDCFALALAAEEQCPLLTGDRALRKAASQESVCVHGMLWMVENMVRHEIITVRKARDAYALMQTGGRRLPWPAAEDRLQRLERELKKT